MKIMHKLKAGLPTIMSITGVIGLGATVVTAIRATPKAITLIKSAEEEKGEKLTKREIVKAVWKPYIPMLAIGLSTAGCIIGSNILNKRQNASIAGAYALVSGTYAEYKNKVKELYGEEAHKKIISSIAAEKSKAEPITAGSYFANSCLDFGDEEDELLFYDVFSKRYFTSTLGKVLQAEYHLNRNYVLRGDISLNEFYEFLGISGIDGGDHMGWNCCDGELYWIDFDHKRETTEDGLEVHFIEMIFEPGDVYSDELLSRPDKYYLANIDRSLTELQKMSQEILARASE